MNQAYVQIMILFVPLALALGHIYPILDIFNVDQEIADKAQKFIWCILPDVFLSAFYEI